MLRFFTLIFLITCFSDIYSQNNLKFNHLNSEDGLSDNRVNCFVQDQRGFMWIGTNNGLNRYDGHEFIAFNTENLGKTRICGNNISALDIDINGRIWIGTEDNGFCSLDPKSLEFRNYSIQNGDSLKFKRISDIIAISENVIGLANQSSYMCKFFIQEDSLKNIKPDHIGSTYEFQKIGVEEIASVGLRGGFRIESHGVIQTNIDSTNRKTYSLNSIHVENDKAWMGSWGNILCEYNLLNKTWDYHALEKENAENSSNSISEITGLGPEHLIIGTDNSGLFIFDKSNDNCYSIDNNEKDESAPRGISIHTFYEDKSGRIWIGSNAGIDIYDPLLNQFEISFLKELNGAKIYDIVKHRDDLFFASTDGLLKFDNSMHSKSKIQLLGTGQKFRSFTKANNEKIYVGTNKTLYEVSHTPFKIKNLPELDMLTTTYASPENLTGSTFSNLFFFEEKRESWLCAMAYGLDLLIINVSDQKAYAFLPAIKNDTTYTTEHLVRQFHVDSKNRLWACGRNWGLIRIDQEFTTIALDGQIHDDSIGKEGIESYFYSEKDGMPSKNVFDMAEDPDGSYWLSTTGHGLIHFQPESENQFTVIDLEFKTIHGLEIDKNGNLWGITSKGILYYNPKEKKHKLFDQADGLSLDGMVGYWYKDENGNLYKGLNGAYIKFQPESIQFNKEIAPVYLTHLSINNSPSDSLLTIQDLELNYDQNFVTFQFSSPSFTNPKLNSYEYILEGVDPEWRMIQGKNEAVYTSLQPGNYEFKIRPANNDGIWGEYKTLTKLMINPPWYRTWWFYTFVILSIAAFLFGLYKYRIAQLVKFYEMRNQIARDLHDDIGSTLGSISFYSEVAEQQLRKKGESSAEDVVQKIGSTSREMMDNIGDIVWAVNPKNDTIEKIVDRMKNYAVPLLSSKAIDIDFKVDENLNLEKLGMEIRKNMFLIFKESIHNSLKYSQCKKMNISLLKDGKGIILSIKDNGIGFDTKNSSAYNGNGMVNIRERAKEINAELNIESSSNQGTTVALKFNLI